MSKTRSSAVWLWVLATIALLASLLILAPLVNSLAWALALAIVAYPLQAWLVGRLQRPNIAAGLSVVVVALVILLPAVLLTEPVITQALTAVQAARTGLEQGALRDSVNRYPPLARVVDTTLNKLNAPAGLQRMAESMASRSASLLSGSAWIAAQAAITLYCLFFFLRDGAAAVRWMRRLAPLSRSEADLLLQRITDTMYATIYGRLAVAAVQGLLGGLMFWWLGLAAPVVWGLVMGLLAVVPVLGTFVIWIPAAAYLALTGQYTSAIVLAAWGTCVIGVSDNLLYPILVRNRMRMHNLLVFLSVIGGLVAFGAVGVILGPLAFACTAAALEIARLRNKPARRRKPKSKKAPQPSAFQPAT